MGGLVWDSRKILGGTRKSRGPALSDVQIVVRHMGISINAFLRNRAELVRLSGIAHKPDGTTTTFEEMLSTLRAEQAKGRKVLPLEPCDCWDFEHGCPGHPIS